MVDSLNFERVTGAKEGAQVDVGMPEDKSPTQNPFVLFLDTMIESRSGNVYLTPVRSDVEEVD